mgnify:CR=1 FL=1
MMIQVGDTVLVIGWMGRNPVGSVLDIDQWGFAHVLIGTMFVAYRHPDTLSKVGRNG